METLNVAHRPTTWDGVVGHRDAVRVMKDSLEAGTSRSFLFVGPTGVGKTTFARLVARSLGIDPQSSATNYVEFDGATNTGVEDMRGVLLASRLRPMGSIAEKVIVIDEAHMLSKAAWNCALKSVEEPPPGVHWVFCTSEGTKVPATIRSRCQQFNLLELNDKDIALVVKRAAKAEEVELSKEKLALIVDHACGLPRTALVALGMVLEASDDEAESILTSVDATGRGEVFDMCRMLASGCDLKDAVKLVGKFEGATAEGVRVMICNYFTKVAVGGGRGMHSAIAVLSAFGDPYPAGIGGAMYPVLVSLGVLFED